MSNYFKKPFKRDNSTVYEVIFPSLYALYKYLKSNPSINTNIWCLKEQIASVTNNEEFAGVDLDKAIEYCIHGYNENKDLFLELDRNLSDVLTENTYTNEYEASVFGVKPHYKNIIAGAPKSMYRLKKNESKRFITIHFNLGFPAYTSKACILNRGILTINLIKLLEKNNYQINFKAYELSCLRNEIAYIAVNLKNSGDLLEETKCFFPLTSREFLRRLLFRVLETMPVLNDWHNGYGQSLNENEMRSFLNIPKEDIVISYPINHGIRGNDIYSDAIEFFDSLGISNCIDLESIKKELKKKATL